MISAYCLSFCNWTVIPSEMERVFADMKEIGFDAVDLSYSESEQKYSRRCMELQTELAHKHGLKVMMIPSRLGGRVAGAPMMPSRWLLEHPGSQVPGHPDLAAWEDEAFRDEMREMLRQILCDYGADGIIWDEPKALEIPSTHPATLAKYPDLPPEVSREQGAYDFFTDMTAYARTLNPGLVATMFLMPPTSRSFALMAAKMPGLDYIGYDGGCAPKSFFHEPQYCNKTYIRESWRRLLTEREGATAGTFALVENILLPDTAIEEFEQVYRETLEEIRPDHLSVYYYGHNNESPERIQQITVKYLKEYIARNR